MTSLTTTGNEKRELVTNSDTCDCKRADWLTCQCHRYGLSPVNALLIHGNCKCRCHRDENDRQISADKWKPTTLERVDNHTKALIDYVAFYADLKAERARVGLSWYAIHHDLPPGVPARVGTNIKMGKPMSRHACLRLANHFGLDLSLYEVRV